MILSFHPIIEGDRNILLGGKDPGKSEIAEIRKAKAVILPQVPRKSLFVAATQNCKNVFPDYRMRFAYPDKTGQIRLFEKTGVIFPETLVFSSADECRKQNGLEEAKMRFGFPLVFKFAWGGEGKTVYIIKDAEMLQEVSGLAREYEKTGQKGFMLQHYIHCQNQSLRVVVVNKHYIAYWRVAHAESPSTVNISDGAEIDHKSNPHLREAGIGAARDFCAKTGINLAGMDYIFPGQKSLPYILEINYYFGRKGLGGSETYYSILKEEVSGWIQSL